MPFIHLYTTETVGDDIAQKLTASLSSVASEVLGKSENYVMVAISPAIMRMSNVPGQAAFVDIRAIGGLTPEKNKIVSERICELLESELKVDGVCNVVHYVVLQSLDRLPIFRKLRATPSNH